MPLGRPLLVALSVAALAIAACTNGDEAAPPPTLDGIDLAAYDGPRLSFAYPASWDLDVSEGVEGRIRVEMSDEPDGPLLAAALAAWPILHDDPDDFDRFVELFGTEAGDGIEGLANQDVEVTGATEALLQTYRVFGEDEERLLAGAAWKLLATGEAGRNLVLSVIILDDAVEDPEALGEAIIGSVELAEIWDD
jgi:hypothetical protein